MRSKDVLGFQLISLDALVRCEIAVKDVELMNKKNSVIGVF
jgi:hypothetical protein